MRKPREGVDSWALSRYNYFNKAIFTTMPLFDDYLTVIEAGKRLKIHPETVKRLCRQGDLPAVKLRNTWLIKGDTLNNFAGTYIPKRGARKRLM